MKAIERCSVTARHVIVIAGALACALSLPALAHAASLQKVAQSDWRQGASGLPDYVNMFIYVPDRLTTKPPIVVAPHHCQGTAQSTYNEMMSLVSVADRTGFIMVMPEATGQNCWDAGSSRSLSHGGGGDTGAIVQMVNYVIDQYDADAARVYSVGGSSGGIMTEALLGVYPDVFQAGVSLMGVPCGCWSQNYNDVIGKGNTAQWSGPCAGGNVTKTAEAWGELVRSYYPGYVGHRPRLQHWHGENDTIINYKNHAQDILQWTNVLGLSELPTGTDSAASGATRQFWKNDCGYTVYEAFSLAGVGHNVPFDGNAIATYFGLDGERTLDPETEACDPPINEAGAGGMDGDAGQAGGGAGETGSAGAGGTAGVVAEAGAGGTNPQMPAAGQSGTAGVMAGSIGPDPMGGFGAPGEAASGAVGAAGSAGDGQGVAGIAPSSSGASGGGSSATSCASLRPAGARGESAGYLAVVALVVAACLRRTRRRLVPLPYARER